MRVAHFARLMRRAAVCMVTFVVLLLAGEVLRLLLRDVGGWFYWIALVLVWTATLTVWLLMQARVCIACASHMHCSAVA